MADECGPLNWGCKLKEAGQEGVAEIIAEIVEDITDTIEQSFQVMSTFWVGITPSYISDSDGVTGWLRDYLDPYVVVIVTMSLMIGGIKLALTQNGQTGRELIDGLITLVLVAGLSAPLISMLIIITDQFSAGIIDASVEGGDIGENLWLMMSIGSGGNPVLGLFSALIVGVIMVPASLLQALLMIIRAILLPVLAGTLVLSCAFFTTEKGRAWFQQSLVWLIAFLAYKPAAAIIYSAGFMMMGDGGITGAEDLGEIARTLLGFVMGFSLILLSLLSLGALQSFIMPVSGKLTGGAGAGLMFAGSAAGVVAAGAINNGASNSAASANASSNGPDGAPISYGSGPSSTSGGGGSGPAGPGGSSTPGGPGGSGSTGAPGADGASGAGNAGATGATGAASGAGAAASGAAGAATKLAGDAAKATKGTADGAINGGEKE